MKLFLQYLRQRRRIWIVGAVFCVIFAVSFLLYHLPIGAVIYPTLLCAALGIMIMVFDFLRVKREHEALNSIRSMTDVIAESLPKIDGTKDEDYQQILRLLSEEHNTFRTQTNRKYTDMIDYYTVWAHQIKTPIASMRLHLQNEDSALSRTLTSDLHRIEQYVEMVLTFLRLNSESTDYVIKEYDLDRIIKQAVRKFSSDFIGRKLSLVYEPMNTMVITDEKWLAFLSARPL